MNILITNIHYGPGYALAVAAYYSKLCHRIIATIEPGEFCFRYTKFIQKAYVILRPNFVLDIIPVLYDEINYVNKLLALCQKQQIQLIVPTHDTDLFLLKKYASRFNDADITILGPTYEQLNIIARKDLALHFAEIHNIEVPKYIICNSFEAANDSLAEFTYPVVCKYDFSTGSKGVFLINSPDELPKDFKSKLILQKYISGKEISLHVLIDTNYKCIYSFTLQKHRHLAPSVSTVIEIIDNPVEAIFIIKALESLKAPGFYVCQLRQDIDDGKFKFIEINARFGANTRMLIKLVPDLVNYYLNIYLKKSLNLRQPIKNTLAISFIEDIYSLFILGITSILEIFTRKINWVMFSKILSCYFRDYFLRNKKLDVLFSNLFIVFFAVMPMYIKMLKLFPPTKKTVEKLKLTSFNLDNASF